MNPRDTLKLDRTVVTVTPLSAPSDDKAHWPARSPYERLQAVELLRQLNYGLSQSTPDFKEFLKLLNTHQVEVEVNLIDLAHLKINKKAAGRHPHAIYEILAHWGLPSEVPHPDPPQPPPAEAGGLLAGVLS